MPYPAFSPAERASRRQRLLIATGVAALLLGAGRPGPLQAQGIIGVLPGSEVGGEYRGNWQRYSGRSLRQGTDLREWLQVPLGGRLGDARLAQYRLSLRPEFRQSFFSGATEPLIGRQLAYGFSAELLSMLPVTLRLNSGHTGGYSSGGVGSENRYDFRTAGAVLSSRNRYFPLQAEFTRSTSLTVLRASPVTEPVRTSYDTRRVSASGGSSKLQLRYDRTMFEDRIGTADYDAWDGSVTHFLRWGKGSRLETGLEASTQTGALDYRRRQWTERLHLQHTRQVSSDVSFRRATLGTNDESSTMRDWGYHINGQIGRRWSAGLGVSRSVATTGESEGHVSTITPRLGVTTPVPAGIFLSASGSAGLEVRRQTGAGRTRVQVSDEAHTVPATRTFFLLESDVDTSGIVVRAAGTPVIYTPGTDYLAVPFGRELRIDIPLTSRIQIGDRVLVTYGWFAPTSGDGRALIASYRVSLSRGGVRLEHDRAVRRASSGMTLAGGLPEYDDLSTRLAVRTGARSVRVDMEAALTRRIRGGSARSEVGVGADATWPVTRALTSSAGLHWTRSMASAERVDAISGRLGATWLPLAGLQLIAGAEALLWKPTGLAEDRFLGLTFDTVWHIFAVELVSRYEFSHRTGPLTFRGHRLSTRLVRRF